MAAPSFSDIGKKTDKIIGGKAFSVGSFGFDVSSKQNDVAFTVEGSCNNTLKDGAADCSGKLKGKYTDKDNGFTFTESWGLDGKLNLKAEFEPAQVEGLKLSVDGNYKLKGDSAQKDATIGVDFKHESVTVNSSFKVDPDFKAPEATASDKDGEGKNDKAPKWDASGNVVKVSAATKVQSYVAGVSSGYNLSTSAVGPVDLKVGVSDANSEASATYSDVVNYDKAKVAFSYWHNVSDASKVCGSMAFERKEDGLAPTISVGGTYKLDGDNKYAAGVKYTSSAMTFAGEWTHQLQKDIGVTFTTCVDADKLLSSSNAARIGISVSLGA